MRTPLLLALASVLLSFLPARASTITYTATLDTSLLGGSIGALDLNFQTGPSNAQPATIQILFLTGGGTPTGTATLTGDASGALPGAVQLGNGTGFNDYFQDFSFSSSLVLSFSVSGPALTPPAGTASGSTFALSLFADPGGTLPALTIDTIDGYALTLDINPDGSTTTHVYTTTPTTISAVTPEPPTGWLVASTSLLFFLSPLARRYRPANDLPPKLALAPLDRSSHSRRAY